MSAQQQVITIDDISADNAPAIYVAGGLGQFFDAVKAEVTGEVPDLTTVKGRARIASLAATVSKSKKAVETPGRDYLKRLKEMPKVVEAELREFVDAMDALRDETRKPLTEWEAADAAKKREIEAWVGELRLDPLTISTADSEYLKISIGAFEGVVIDGEWLGDHEAEALRLKADTLEALRAALVKREQYEAEQAELVRLRAEAEAQAQRDRDAEIARVAAEQARLQAEQQAQAERDAAARREQELLDQAAATQRAAAQAALDADAAAERQRLQLELQAEQSRAAAAQAEVNRLAAEQRAEQDRLAAIRRQEEAVEQARLAEIARANAAADEILRQAAAREADLEHQRSINGAALKAFVAGGMTEECAKQAIKLIANRKIPAIYISY
ncbi:hypothetical protein [Pseudomonas yamanorum]|uniref:hypothetical protein n=1 Tax=Pseudomonas yamanorum TaxID=515393 RepID=UPI00087B0CBE|nr:hypothetical protein [Pseudomonas yamanorum]SDT98047.1 hypothetical protein SAMN05216237_1024 [Pseudomonas yamanorum]